MEQKERRNACAKPGQIKEGLHGYRVKNGQGGVPKTERAQPSMVERERRRKHLYEMKSTYASHSCPLGHPTHPARSGWGCERAAGRAAGCRCVRPVGVTASRRMLISRSTAGWCTVQGLLSGRGRADARGGGHKQVATRIQHKQTQTSPKPFAVCPKTAFERR